MSHYSMGQKSHQLLKWAEKSSLTFFDHEISKPVLVYTGMSGISAATALSLQLHVIGIKHGMCYIRKKNEKSHGNTIEWELLTDWEKDDVTPIFVDDFIDQGKTLGYVVKKFGRQIDWICLQFDYNYETTFGLKKFEDAFN